MKRETIEKGKEIIEELDRVREALGELDCMKTQLSYYPLKIVSWREREVEIPEEVRKRVIELIEAGYENRKDDLELELENLG